MTVDSVDELRPDQRGKLLHAGNSPLSTAHTWALLGLAFGLPVAALLGIFAALALAADGPICPAIWTALRAKLTLLRLQLLIQDPGRVPDRRHALRDRA